MYHAAIKLDVEDLYELIQSDFYNISSSKAKYKVDV